MIFNNAQPLTLPAASLEYENELLSLVAEGNEKAFRRIFDHYWHNIYAVALTLTKSAVVSEEIVQDVFLKIWLKRGELASIIKFDAYLFIIARNHIYNELRKKTLEQPFRDNLEEYFADSGLPEQELLMKETKELVHNAVQQLPGQKRTVFELSRNAGLDYTNIAEKLGISKLTVKSHMTKALQYIRHYLQTHTSGLLFAVWITSFIHP